MAQPADQCNRFQSIGDLSCMTAREPGNDSANHSTNVIGLWCIFLFNDYKTCSLAMTSPIITLENGWLTTRLQHRCKNELLNIYQFVLYVQSTLKRHLKKVHLSSSFNKNTHISCEGSTRY